MERKITSLELPEDLKKQLQVEAADKEMSISALIRWIIKQYFKNKKE